MTVVRCDINERASGAAQCGPLRLASKSGTVLKIESSGYGQFRTPRGGLGTVDECKDREKNGSQMSVMRFAMRWGFGDGPMVRHTIQGAASSSEVVNCRIVSRKVTDQPGAAATLLHFTGY